MKNFVFFSNEAYKNLFTYYVPKLSTVKLLTQSEGILIETLEKAKGLAHATNKPEILQSVFPTDKIFPLSESSEKKLFLQIYCG